MTEVGAALAAASQTVTGADRQMDVDFILPRVKPGSMIHQVTLVSGRFPCDD